MGWARFDVIMPLHLLSSVGACFVALSSKVTLAAPLVARWLGG